MPAPRRVRIVDISRSLSPSTFVFPGDPPVSIEAALAPERGDPARVSRLSFGSHAGTHLDAPSHLPGLFATLESIPLETLVGEALVVQAAGRSFGRAQAAALPRRLPPRLLLKGGPVVTPEGASALLRRGVRLVGTDGRSIDPIDDDAMPAHRVLLEAGAAILECLDLSQAPAGRCELIALPLRIDGADGAPVRAILRISRGAAQRSRLA